MRKLLFLIFTLAASAVALSACSQKEVGGFYNLYSSFSAAETAIKFVPEQGTFYKVLSQDRASVFTVEGEETLFGLASTDTGKTVLPIRYSAITANGDFFLAESSLSDDKLFYVFYKDGTELFSSDYPLTIEDLSEGYVKITEGTSALLYSEKAVGARFAPITGEAEEERYNVLFGSRFAKEDTFAVCGPFISVQTAKDDSCFIFSSRTGECLHRVLGGDEVSPSVYYAGGNDFIVILNYKVKFYEAYDAAFVGEDETVYIDQKVFRVTIGVEGAREIEPNRFIYKLHNRYEPGLTPSERARYPVKDGYFAEADYEVSGGEITGRIGYVISDKRLNVLKALPQDVSPLTVNTGGKAPAVDAEHVYLLNDDLSPTLTISNENYQSVKWSDGVLVLSTIEDGKVRYGALDENGRELLPFDYSYLSDFKSGAAVGVRDGKAFVVTKDGNETYVSSASFPYDWDGFAIAESGEKKKLVSLFGYDLISEGYDEFINVERYGDRVFVTACVGSLKELFVLS